MVNLGDKVRDAVTGFEGIATSRHSYLTGCDRIGVQAPAVEGKDGWNVPSSATFDEMHLVVVEVAVVEPYKPDRRSRHRA